MPQQIFEKLWVEYLLDQPEEQENNEPINSSSPVDEVARDLKGLVFFGDPVPSLVSLSSSLDTTASPLPPAVPKFVTAFTSCSTVLRAATWNVQQLKFIFHEEKLDSVAQHLASSYELIFLQEIPPGHNGECRLRQLLRAMNGGNSSLEPRFNYLLGRETVVLDTASQLNAIIYPASWKVIHQASLTSFLHPPVMAWFKAPDPLSSTVLCASFHISPSTGLASSSSASQEEGIPSRPSKATSTASKTTVQSRLHLQLSKIVETAQAWDVFVPSHLDQKEFSPRWIIGGDLNVVPDSLPHGLALTTPRGMPTAIASRRTLDGFILDPLTAKTHNPLIDLVKADATLSDHNLVSLMLKEY